MRIRLEPRVESPSLSSIPSLSTLPLDLSLSVISNLFFLFLLTIFSLFFPDYVIACSRCSLRTDDLGSRPDMMACHSQCYVWIQYVHKLNCDCYVDSCTFQYTSYVHLLFYKQNKIKMLFKKKKNQQHSGRCMVRLLLKSFINGLHYTAAGVLVRPLVKSFNSGLHL